MPEGKPAILAETRFSVHEGWAYRAMRGGAIWMNKLFFSSLVLLAVWLVLAVASDEVACADSVRVVEAENGTLVDEGPASECSVFLTPTAKYLGAMAVLSFLLSIAFGLLGLVVGKRVVALAKAEEEVGAQREAGGPGQGKPPGPSG